MDDVAKEFGISKKTLYQFFNDKEDLVEQVVDYYLENPVFNLLGGEHGNSIDAYFALRNHLSRILKYFDNTIEYDLKKTYPSLHMKVHNRKRENIYTNAVSNLKEGISSGLYRDDLDVELVARLQVGRLLLTLDPENQIFTETEVANITFFDKIINYHMHAICTEKGIKYYYKQLNKIKNEDQN